MNVFCIVNQTGHLSSPTRKVRLDEPLAYSNSRAHSFRFTVLAEGSESPADLTGVGVTAQFLRSGNNTTVTPINGTVTGNVCEVILPASCYNVPGRFTFTMDIASNNESRTVLWVEGIVERNMSGDIIDPGTPVPNITAAINNANAAAEGANSAAEAARQAAQEATGAVSYEEQTGKTDAQKATARTNIGAASEDDVASLRGVITPYHEDSMVATRAYTSGDILMVGAKLYKTKTTISSGATLSSSNIAEITLREYLSGTGLAFGNLSHAEGDAARASGTGAHAEGYKTVAGGNYSHAEGNQTSILNGAAHAEGVSTQANGNGAHSEGLETSAVSGSHAEGYKSKTTASYAHAEGKETTASGAQAHAEGNSATASGTESHAEGYMSTASGNVSHAEGGNTTASGIASHAEGGTTNASGSFAHAEGDTTQAVGEASHVEGYDTKATHAYQHVFGTSNIFDSSQSAATAKGTYVEIVGNGTNSNNRSNARTLDWSGNEELAGDLTVHKGGANEMAVGQELSSLKSALNAMRTATAEDEGKALKAKTVEDGTVTEWEFGEAVTVDDTLTQAGEAADAKAAGDAINAINSAVFIDKSASGSVVSFSDGNGMALKSLAVDIVYTQSGSGDPSPTNIRTINGFTGANINVGAVSGTPDETYHVDWEQEAGTIYHGTLDVTSGILTVDWVIRDISQFSNITKGTNPNEPWIHRFSLRHWPPNTTWEKKGGTSNFVSDIFKRVSSSASNYEMSSVSSDTVIYVYDNTVDTVDEFKAKYAGHYIAYEVADRFVTTYQLTPMQVLTLVGANNIWADTGDIALAYRVGLGDQIAGKQDALTFDSAPTENSTNPVTSGGIADAYGPMVTAVSKITGKAIAMETGDYYGNPRLGTTDGLQHSTSNYGKCVMVELPAGQTLRFVTMPIVIAGGNVDQLIKNFYTYDASTEICIDVQNTPQKKGKIYTYYLRYDVDVRVYLNCNPAFDCFIEIFGNTSPNADISKLALVTKPSIMEINGEKYIDYAVRSLKWAQKNGNSPRTPAVFLHFSDIHDDGENIKRIVDFMNEQRINPSLDDIICTGDVVYNTINDGMDFLTNVSGSNKIILLPGNHDCAKITGSTTVASTPLETYNTLMADNIGDWGVTQPTDAETNGLCYFYKDYSSYKLRMIFLDGSSHGDSSYFNAEVTWLEETLSGAYALGYSVVCLDHYPFKPNSYRMVECSFSPAYNFNQPAGYLPDEFVTAVDDFINGGGDFVCWLAGHWHQDYVMLNNAGTQLCIGVGCATHEGRSNVNTSYCDCLREANTKGQDLFNIVGIDTLSKNISILRIGCDLTRLMNSRKHLCINYETKTVVWND